LFGAAAGCWGRRCGASGLAAVELVQTLDTKILYDVCGCEYQGLRYLLEKKASTTRVGGMYDAALIMLGTNDLAQMELSAEDILTAITELHALCHSYGLRTVALPIPPNRFSSVPARGREDLVQYQARWERVNCLLKEWAEASAQANRVLYVDVTDSLPEWSEDGECWESDGLHFSAAGSQRLGELLGADEPLKVRAENGLSLLPMSLNKYVCPEPVKAKHRLSYMIAYHKRVHATSSAAISPR
jgi:lysophospholipase L1-like esterase